MLVSFNGATVQVWSIMYMIKIIKLDDCIYKHEHRTHQVVYQGNHECGIVFVKEKHKHFNHGVEWTMVSIEDPQLNGNVPIQTLSVRNMVGELIVPGQNTVLAQPGYSFHQDSS
jgi:hypothetical protein